MRFIASGLSYLVTRRINIFSNAVIDSETSKKCIEILRKRPITPNESTLYHAIKLDKLWNDYYDLKQLTKELKQSSNVESLDDLAQSEIVDLQEAILSESKILVDNLNWSNTSPCTSVLLEVHAGAGGDEALLFASELHNMYYNYCLFKGWNVYEPSDTEKRNVHGKPKTLLVDGPADCSSINSRLLQEAGVHRIQRVPLTERQGRVHTSTVSLAVIRQSPEGFGETMVPEKECRIKAQKKASGPGGQSVNTTSSCAVVTHLPSGITVERSNSRSFFENKRLALIEIARRIRESNADSARTASLETRRSQIGRMERNERIRTYNVPQDRVTDHRLHRSTSNIRGFLAGTDLLDSFIDQLVERDRHADVARLVDEIRRQWERMSADDGSAAS